MKDQRLISVDELRAAGALDVPAAWRKSLSVESSAKRDLFSGLNDDEPLSEDEQPANGEADGDGSAREPR